MLPALPSYFPLPVLVVQHMPELFTRSLAERLDGACRMRVCEAAEGAAVRAGEVVIARGDWHLEVQCDGARSGEAAPDEKPAGEPLPAVGGCTVPLLRRGVRGGHVLAVVLTGMGSDGLAGCRALREAGATVLAQDEASSTVWGMPGAVAQAGLANRILPLDQMAAELVWMASGKLERGAEASGRDGLTLANHGSSADYAYLRRVVLGRSQNVLDPSRDFLFETKLAPLMRNCGLRDVRELVEHMRRTPDEQLESAVADRHDRE